MTTDTITFAQMGFANTATEASATTATDGYIGTLNGMPYNIHPTVTPDAYAALQAAIAAGDVTVTAYVAPVITLAQVQASQSAVIDAAYEAAVQQPVSFTTVGGVTQTFQADPASQTLLVQSTQGYTIAGAVPAGFYWKAADNTAVTFTLADLQGLYSATLAQGWAAFQKRSALKQQIAAVTVGNGTVAQAIVTVQAIVWN
jgi:hypothetical protein